MKAMKLIDKYTGEMECRVCGSQHWSSLKRGGGYVRGSWQCVNGCKPDAKANSKKIVIHALPA